MSVRLVRTANHQSPITNYQSQHMPIKEKLKLYLHLDWPIVGAMLALAVAGVFAIYSASYRGDDQAMPTFYLWQMRWIALGLVVFLAAIWVDYEWWCRWS